MSSRTLHLPRLQAVRLTMLSEESRPSVNLTTLLKVNSVTIHWFFGDGFQTVTAHYILAADMAQCTWRYTVCVEKTCLAITPNLTGYLHFLRSSVFSLMFLARWLCEIFSRGRSLDSFFQCTTEFGAVMISLLYFVTKSRRIFGPCAMMHIPLVSMSPPTVV